MSLNYYKIHRVLGGKMVQGEDIDIGGLNLLESNAEYIKTKEKRIVNPKFSITDLRYIVKAFELVRNQAPTDQLLWDKKLALTFCKRAWEMGVDADSKRVITQLINIRKNPGLYEPKGLAIKKFGRSVKNVSVQAEYAHAIEFALVKLRAKYGLSIDSLLADQSIADELDRTVRSAFPRLLSDKIRRGALYIRKSHTLSGKKARNLFDEIDPISIESAMTRCGTLMRPAFSRIPIGPGLLEITEQNDHLYVGNSISLRKAVDSLASTDVLEKIAGNFWDPNLANIQIRIFQGHSFQDIPLHMWQLRLVADKQPIFNWPYEKKTG